MKNRDEIYQTVHEILVTMFEIEPEDISMEANLYEELDLDSIDAVDLVVKLRELSGKKIEPDEFKEVRTVKDIVDSIEKLMNQ